MKIKKKYSFKDNKQIWRLLITDTDLLIIETRNVESREVYFNCIDIHSGKKKFNDFQMEEKSWIGIETIYKDIIFFHQYAKPDMPEHRRISAYDINKQKILWENDEFTFGFVTDDIVYAHINTMVGEKYFPLNYKTGEIISEDAVGTVELLELRSKSESEKDYSNYKFSEIYNSVFAVNEDIREFVEQQITKVDITGNIEYIIFNNLLMMNYHSQISFENIRNEFVVVNKLNGNKIFSEILNKSAKAFVPDSFFVYKNILILLKEKNEVIICQIIDN